MAGDTSTNVHPQWRFYAPGLDKDGSLSTYITSKGYLGFIGSQNTLNSADGFWVNAVSSNGIAPPTDSGISSFALPWAGFTNGLVSYWHLDGNWHDSAGTNDLVAFSSGGFSTDVSAGQVYGPSGSDTGNGAVNPNFTLLPEANGITLAGWALVPDNGTGGVLFGFAADGWASPQMNIYINWGFPWVNLGQGSDGALVQYARISDNCWHHLALVLPANFRTAIPFRMYIDGQEVLPTTIDHSATGNASLGTGATLWGSPFVAGAFTSPNGADSSARNMKIDEVGVWQRALGADEVALLAAQHGGAKTCQNAPIPNWAPGPRFITPPTPPTPQPTLGVHVLTNDTIAVITDPNPWLKQRITIDSGAYLTAMESVRNLLPTWMPQAHYELATEESILHYRPGILAALSGSGHFSFSGSDINTSVPPVAGLWPQSTREFRTPSFAANGGEIHTAASEVVYYSYLKLAQPMHSGTSYTVADEWGNTHSFTYDEQQTLSWAIKVNQVGYQADSNEKIAYVGSWLGPNGGALDLQQLAPLLDGSQKTFNLIRESDGSSVFTGNITFRGDESQPIPIPPAKTETVRLSGEKIYQLDFSPVTATGRYHVQIPGIGRSWSFDIGPHALGEAFFVHARGLYHQRCGSLDPARTPWSRGDAHHPIRKAYHPTELNAYGNHSTESAPWGFMDANGVYPAGGIDAFTAITATKTDQVISSTSGEWHDAGDFSLDGMGHVRVVEYLTEAYLMYPQNFTDNQLNIPESGNGIPDILDEAIWGMDLWRRLQEPDGRVALYVEAESHPQIADPAIDTQPYYQGLATRNSSLLYAENAARLAQALNVAGANAQATLFLNSAKRAYSFAMTDYVTIPRISMSFTLNGGVITWIEPAHQDTNRQVKALVQLWLASGDQQYFDAMNTTEMTSAFAGAVGSLYWRDSGIDFMDVAMAPEKFPSGWGGVARNGIVSTADEWLGWQNRNPYRNLWYAPGEGYFPLMGWGNNGYYPALNLIAAWKTTGDDRYRAGASHMVNFMIGANPQGRSLTTGLGSNYVVHPLHLPSDSDGIADPVPGITIYGYGFGIPFAARQVVYGLFNDANPGMAFDGVALAQLPPPWNNTAMSLTEISNTLYSAMPIWRNMVTMEAANVPQNEFTVPETIGPATLVTGVLMGAGWTPPPTLLNRKPKTAAELQDALWYQP
jgi:endoglucanase